MKSKTIFSIVAVLFGFTSTTQAQTPKTLLELSGVQRPKIDFNNSVLIIIDAQEEYKTGQLPLVGLDAAVESTRKLLTQARQKGIPVIHVLNDGGTGQLFNANGKYFKSIAELAPQARETVILKHFPNAFSGTSLAKELENYKGKTLIFAGFMTHMCVNSTASAALELGYQNVIVKDAVASRDLRGPNGETIPAATVNQVSLAQIQDRLAWLVETQELLLKR